MRESIKESLVAIMPSNSQSFGAYSAKGNNAMRTIAKALVRDLIKLEESGVDILPALKDGDSYC